MLKTKLYVTATVPLLAAYLWAAPASIGVATAHGNFLVDRAKVQGTATLYDGSLVETEQASSLLQLPQSRLNLASGSKGQVYRDHFVLERGQGQIDAKSAFPIEARRLRIEPGAGAEAKVVVTGARRVQVAALRGNLRVRTLGGTLLANMSSGMALEFDPQDTGAAGPTTITGTLTKVAQFYILRDETTNTVFQVTGCSDLDNKVNKTVRVTGSLVANATPAGGAAQVIQVDCNRVVVLGAAGAGTAIGLSRTAIITGVGVAAVGAGVGLGVALSDDGAANTSN